MCACVVYLYTPAFPVAKQSGSPSKLTSIWQYIMKTAWGSHLFHKTSPLLPFNAIKPPPHGGSTSKNIVQNISGLIS